MSSATFDTIAAIDLGSNSFHMIVADVRGERPRVIDRIRETVRLGSGLDARNRLTTDAMDRAITSLEKFGERVRGLPAGAVRVVGTNTLRQARNRLAFLARAEAALGHAVDVISGFEEARLIYLGVCSALEDDSDTRLIIDIGGGSTEFILGRRFEPQILDSLHIGCLSFSTRFFPDGNVTRRRMRDAEIAALQEIESIERTFRDQGWDAVVGASGTILAVRDVLLNTGWSRDGISRPALLRLRDALIDAGRADGTVLPGLSPDREPVFAGGIAILSAAFEGLALETMRVSDSALREGLLFDLLGRLHMEDIRERTIADLAVRYHVDQAQARRIDATVVRLFAETAADWNLGGIETQRLLRWSASLHEIGMVISHSHYHKHSAYLLTHLDMPGFALGEQQQLAALVRGHRRSLASEEFAAFDEQVAARLLRCSLLLRLAVVLHRRRTDERLPELDVQVDARGLKLCFPAHWLEAHPLTRADLEQEAAFQKVAGFKLRFR